SSREAHAKQKVLAKERKASKPNADSIARSKKIWERLRLKSHVPREERKQLVEELFDIIQGRIKDFVFKHDSVRVVQCALKYANMTQRRMIANELKGEFITLAESRYAKFLVAKLVVEGDKDIQNMIIAEFHGHVRKMINHPEASWILDDIYRQVATKDQKAVLLKEWYGPEYAIFKASEKEKRTATLSDILEEAPEKRKPMLSYLYNLINQLVQKKLTGFTMLHDAMLQYYLNCKPGSEEATEFLELLKGQGDEEEKDHDLLKNLAFTASGARIVCMALAYGAAKDRRYILKVYKDMIEILAQDIHGHGILLAAYDVIDDTVMISKAIFPELIGKGDEPSQQADTITALANHPTGRIALLYPFASATTALPKALLSEADMIMIKAIHDIRTTTSKKDPAVRRQELVRGLSSSLLATVASQASTLAQTVFGCYFITEVLLAAEGDSTAAFKAVATLVQGDPGEEAHIARNPSSGRMLKTLVQGGHFDPKEKTVRQVRPSGDFCTLLFEKMKGHLLQWATGSGAFIVLALVEQDGWIGKEALLKSLGSERAALKKAIKRAESDAAATPKETSKEHSKSGQKAAVAGMKLLLERLD
ncbi:ARM repeat-containing protein, partial [Rhizodiscina lignyota]